LQPLAVGAPGIGIGYQGLAESLAVEFDMWKDLDNQVRVNFFYIVDLVIFFGHAHTIFRIQTTTTSAYTQMALLPTMQKSGLQFKEALRSA
jgi:hypothetical protein